MNNKRTKKFHKQYQIKNKDLPKIFNIYPQ